MANPVPPSARHFDGWYAEPAGSSAPAGRPVLAVPSPEDTDIGWGERAEPDDDERLIRERPPHWGSG